MKTRKGFVSNSSSSSFIIGISSELSRDQFKKELKNSTKFSISPDSVLYDIRESLIEYITDLAFSKDGKEFKSIEDAYTYFGVEEGDELPQIVELIMQCLLKEYLTRSFSICDDGYEIERMLNIMEFSIETDNIILEKMGY